MIQLSKLPSFLVFRVQIWLLFIVVIDSCFTELDNLEKVTDEARENLQKWLKLSEKVILHF